MALNADTLLDRIALKNQTRRWRMLALTLAVVSVLVIGGEFSSVEDRLHGDYIARITLDDIIEDDPTLLEMMEDIATDDEVKAVILRVDSPGGGTVGSEEIYLALRDIAKNKPIVCTMRTYAASGGYLAAIGADYILAREGTLTGSIGVIMQTAEVTSLAEKLGIKPITVRSGELKASPNPLQHFTDKQRALIQSVIDDFFDYFLNLVKTRRKLTDEAVAVISDGRVLSARKALKLGLIDAIGGEREAVKWLEKEHDIENDLEIIEAEPEDKRPPMEKLLEKYGSRFLPTFSRKGLDGLAAIWQPAGLVR